MAVDPGREKFAASFAFRIVPSMKGSAGFATSAATLASLAISLVVAAVVASSISQLRLAQSQMVEARVQDALDGAHHQAALGLMERGSGARFRWVIATQSGEAQAVAEAEASKLSLAAASELQPSQLQRLGVNDPSDLRGRLASLASAGSTKGLGLYSADSAPLWRACARSVVSPYGRDVPLTSAEQAAMGSGPNSRGAGEVWRVRLTLDGWTDDRVIRFAGDPRNPAWVVERRFYRWDPAADRCPQI